MFLALFAIWLILNEHITLEICLFGAGIATAVYGFSWAFLGFTPKKDLHCCKRVFWLLCFVLRLLYDIVRANFAVISRVLRPGYRPDPVLVRITTPLQRRFARALYADCITLTPGTITVSLEDGVFTVHCLDTGFSEGLDSAPIIRIIQRLEARV